MLLTQEDLNNYKFLISLNSEEDWDNWADQVEEDDLNYALELLMFIKQAREHCMSYFT